MLTKNYYVMQAISYVGLLNASTQYTEPKWKEDYGQLTSLSGESSNFSTNYSIPILTTYSSQVNSFVAALYNERVEVNCDMIVGSSNEAENIEDYKLKAELTELSKTNIQFAHIGYVEGGKHEIIFTKTFTNNTDSPVTINEVGLTKIYLKYHYTTKVITETGPYLIARNVLDKPIVVESGKTVTVSMTLDL